MIKRHEDAKKVGRHLDKNGYWVTEDGKLEHRSVYAKHWGYVPQGWIVHHIDHVKTNNDPMNLIAMPEKLHGKLHTKLRRENNRKMTREETERYLEKHLKKAHTRRVNTQMARLKDPLVPIPKELNFFCSMYLDWVHHRD